VLVDLHGLAWYSLLSGEFNLAFLEDFNLALFLVQFTGRRPRLVVHYLLDHRRETSRSLVRRSDHNLLLLRLRQLVNSWLSLLLENLVDLLLELLLLQLVVGRRRDESSVGSFVAQALVDFWTKLVHQPGPLLITYELELVEPIDERASLLADLGCVWFFLINTELAPL